MDKFVKILRVILVLFFLIWLMSWSSIRAYKFVERGNPGYYNQMIVELYNTPYEIRRWFHKNTTRPHLGIQIDSVKAVLKIGEAGHLSLINDSIFLLHYRLINKSSSEILLQNIKTGEIAQKWIVPVDEIMIDSDSIREQLEKSYVNGNTPKDLNLEVPQNIDEIIIRHTMMLEDGSILFKVAPYGYIYKIDKYSKILWKSKKLAHHSIELDENGNIWTCIVNLNNSTASKLGYKDDAILCLDQKGNEMYYKSLTDIFLENNLFAKLIESTPVGSNWNNKYKDPYHLNDVKPVMKDGTFWKKGDIFLSLRNKSLVALFRPNTGKIIMNQQGPWLMQHDIDILNDSIISIFNNNVSFLNDEVKSMSNVANYNFKTGKTQFNFINLFSTKYQGRKSELPSNDIFIEATLSGIYYILDSIGNIKYKFYVPYLPDPKFAQYPGWSRIYMKENGIFIEK